MKYSLVLCSVVCVLSSALGNLCDFVLDAESLQSSVLDTNTPALVAFTRDEEQAVTAELMQKSVESLGDLGFCVGTFDCTDAKNAKLCSITAGNFPFIALYLGEPKLNPYTKNNYRDHLPFLPKDNSKDTSRKIDKFVSKALGSDRIVIADSEAKVSSLLTTDIVATIPQVLLLSSKGQSNILWRRIAFHFGNSLQFVQIKADADWVEETDTLKDAIGDHAVPSVLVRSTAEDGGLVMPLPRYTGDLKNFDEIVAWLTPYAVMPDPDSSSKSNNGSSDTKSNENKSIKVFSTAEFATILTDTSSEDLVHVVAVRKSDTEEVDLSSLQKKCYGAISCVDFICPSSDEKELDESIARFCQDNQSSGGIPSDPYLLIVPYTPTDRARMLAAPSKFIFKSTDGVFSPETQAAVAKKAQDFFPESYAMTIDESQLQNFLAASVQQQVFSMIVLASPGKTTPPSMLRHVGAVHKDITKIAYISDPSPQFLQQFDMKDISFPSALALVPSPGGEQVQAMFYDKAHLGGMNFRSLTRFVYGVIDGVPGMKDLYLKKMKQKQEGSVPNEDAASSVETLELVHITSQEQWQEHCGPSFKGICAVGFVGAPDLTTGEYDNSSLSVFETLMNSLPHHMKASFHFIWIDIVCQSKLAENFDLTPDTAPSLIMYSPLKRRYAKYVGNFKLESLKSFAAGMLNSKVATVPMKGEDAVVYDNSVSCIQEMSNDIEEDVEMGDFLAEIKAEEEARAEAVRQEIEAERAAEQEKIKKEAESKKKKKKKKKKKAKKEL